MHVTVSALHDPEHHSGCGSGEGLPCSCSYLRLTPGESGPQASPSWKLGAGESLESRGEVGARLLELLLLQ